MTKEQFTIQAVLAMAPNVIGSNGITDNGDWQKMVDEAFGLADEVESRGLFNGVCEKGLPKGAGEGNEIPEEELSEYEKRIKRMAEEYEQLAGRYERLYSFLATDTYKQLPENKRTLLERQEKAMREYLEVLKQRLRIECGDTKKEG